MFSTTLGDKNSWQNIFAGTFLIHSWKTTTWTWDVSGFKSFKRRWFVRCISSQKKQRNIFCFCFSQHKFRQKTSENTRPVHSFQNSFLLWLRVFVRPFRFFALNCSTYWDWTGQVERALQYNDRQRHAVKGARQARKWKAACGKQLFHSLDSRQQLNDLRKNKTNSACFKEKPRNFGELQSRVFSRVFAEEKTGKKAKHFYAAW